MDPHNRIYSGTGSYGMSQNRFQNNQGRYSSSPSSSSQCNFPYGVMLPQQQQKLNPVGNPSSSSFGYSQLPQSFGQFSRKGQNQRPGTNVNYVQLNWKDLFGSNQNGVGTSGTSQVILGGNENTSATSQGRYNSYNVNPQQFSNNNTQAQTYQQVNTQNLPSEGQQYYQPPMQSYPSSQMMYNTNGQSCGNHECQNCQQSQDESPIKFKVSVGNHGDGLGAPTYEYTFPSQNNQQDAAYTSGDNNTQALAAQPESLGNPNDDSSAAVRTASPSTTNNDVSKGSTSLQPNIRDPCGNCNACKFKPDCKPIPISVSKNTTKKLSPSPCPIPKLAYNNLKQKTPTASVITVSRKPPTTRKSSNAAFSRPDRVQSAVNKPGSSSTVSKVNN